MRQNDEVRCRTSAWLEAMVVFKNLRHGGILDGGCSVEPVLVFVGFAVLALVVRLMAGSFDGERVERYVREQGWTLIDRSWDPFGPGWFGEEDSRIYQIVYRDQQGNVHRAHVKTAMLSGVYLTNDRIVQRADQPDAAQEGTLAEENRRLRERIKELEAGGK